MVRIGSGTVGASIALRFLGFNSFRSQLAASRGPWSRRASMPRILRDLVSKLLVQELRFVFQLICVNCTFSRTGYLQLDAFNYMRADAVNTTVIHCDHSGASSFNRDGPVVGSAFNSRDKTR